MGKKIIVAGAGHGGLAAASQLAKAGFDVTVYERNAEGNLGYDWTDTMDPRAFKMAGIEMPPKDMYEYKPDITFYGPSWKTPIRQHIPEDVIEIKIERKVLYNTLINHALKCGVKIEYGVSIKGPVMQGDRVVGIDTDKGQFFGDMVIDACGCESPVRANLPDCLGIQKHPIRFEKFYTYRAIYDLKIDPKTVENNYKIVLLPEGKIGIGWVETDEDSTDMLIGRFDPFDLDEAKRTAEVYRKQAPELGTELLRGGHFAEIPVRQPLSILVADGYAAIGDSAFMTMPVIGSGIANSIKTSKILSDVIIGDKTETYSAEVLWKYQRGYYKFLGAGLAPLASVKLALTKVTPEELDYIFDKGILTVKELTISADSTSLWSLLHFDTNLPKRGLAIISNLPLAVKMAGVVLDVIRATLSTYILMPKEYSRAKVQRWAKFYDETFR